MNHNQQNIPPEFKNLSLDDRIAYVQDLWDFIAMNPDSLQVSDEHKRILDERLDSFDENPDSGVPWEEFRNELLTKLRKI